MHKRSSSFKDTQTQPNQHLRKSINQSNSSVELVRFSSGKKIKLKISQLKKCSSKSQLLGQFKVTVAKQALNTDTLESKRNLRAITSQNKQPLKDHLKELVRLRNKKFEEQQLMNFQASEWLQSHKIMAAKELQSIMMQKQRIKGLSAKCRADTQEMTRQQEEFEKEFFNIPNKQKQLKEQTQRLRQELFKLKQFTTNTEEEKENVEVNSILQLAKVASTQFDINILRIQFMKQWRTSTQTVPNNVPPKEIFMYTAWNSKDMKLDMMEMVYYVLLNLYPRWNHVIPKIPFTSKVFEILLKGQRHMQMAQDIAKRFMIDDKDHRKVDYNQVGPKALLVLCSQPPNTLTEQFRNMLSRHLTGFTNDIITVHIVSFSQVKEGLEEIKVIYTFDSVELVRTFYILNLNYVPTPQQYNTILDKRRKSDLSSLLQGIGQRRGYFFIRIPSLIQTNQFKPYSDLMELLRKQK